MTWDKCIVEPTCDNLPDPDPSSGLRRKGEGAAVDMVKMGHSVVYECINRTLYQERDCHYYFFTRECTVITELRSTVAKVVYLTVNHS